MVQRLFSLALILPFLFISYLESAVAQAFDPYLAPRLGVSLATLQTALEKAAGPVTFTPRTGSQSTQEARLADNTGIVQAGGDPGNLAAVVLWLPVDAQGKLAGAKARPCLTTFVELFTPESEPVVRWIEQMLERAIADTATPTHLEAQLFAAHQFKALYTRTLSPAMLSLTVISARE
ncbi:MAG: hypothetical protein ACRERD_17465 [Candidatus Binatia bacterium]